MGYGSLVRGYSANASSSELTGTEIIEDLRKQRLKVIEVELHKHG